jgi:hypothetical protein
MGLFAGSGVGKSVLMGMMTRGTAADVVACLHQSHLWLIIAAPLYSPRISVLPSSKADACSFNASYNANPGGYAVAIPRGRSRVPRIMDAASTQSDLGRYANDCRPANRDENECSEQRQVLS